MRSSPWRAPGISAAPRRAGRLRLEPQPAAARHGGAARRPPDEPHHAQRCAHRSRRIAAGPCRPRHLGCRRGTRSGARPAGRAVGRLRINAPPPAIDLVLAPMVAPFLAAHPKIDLEIVGESSFVDIVAGGFDAGVRYGEHLAQDMIAVSLGARSATRWWPRANMSRSMEGRSIRRICWSIPASAPASAAARCWTGNSRRRARRKGLTAGQIDRDLSGPGAARGP
jgi:Transcriptional regulator